MLSSSFLRHYEETKTLLNSQPRSGDIGADGEQLETIKWTLNRLDEIQRISHAFGELMNVEFDRAWGERGVPGNDVEIISTCRLFGEMCESAIAWEETVRFVTVDDIFVKLRKLFVGLAGIFVEDAAKVPKFLAESIGDNPEPGEYRLNLTLELPEGWEGAFSAALESASNALVEEF